ncbi:hypothetical protein H8S90_08565 [Olivibacter sp. SDN3]|uniref:capsule assembly Wzi family protein n=1 Tax=Olivibacter sp. SDN3 TaxID=2764720 RepID=UPI0016518DE4|nr:capsule assembly Wzi family protein [Olivibacter sp. SDN3]QNL51608.1 hypothetical protein H8S90_08565 [Olivibacter sp. SDN3]
MVQKFTVLVLVIFGNIVHLSGQTLPVGTTGLEDYYRREQLLGRLDSTLSFNVRPLSQEVLQQHNIFDPTAQQATSNSILWEEEGRGRVQLLPVTWQNQVTSSYPYGWNDGPMVPTTGYQTMFSAGIYASYKFLSVQLRPEVVYAQNSDYLGFRSDDGGTRIRYAQILNRIDMPPYFGEGSYSKAFLGQSSVRLNFHPISIGVSTENIWWGPGRRNALLMSNTAPGFPHITLNTTKPIRTPIGSIEGQFVTGYTRSSGIDPTLRLEEDYTNLYRPKDGIDRRYFQGVVLSYQPKWLPGLSLGLNRSVIINRNNMADGFRGYFPLFNGLSKSSSLDPETGEVAANQRRDDEYFSIFGRWVIPDAQLEVYGEYGRNDASWDFRDLLVQLEHSRAYMIGFRKLVDLHKPEGDLLQVGMEFTQLEAPKTATLRESLTWYTHSLVRNGYTHQGQILGAGVGPGNNVQSLDVSWIRGIKQLGVEFERLVHNNDFFYQSYGAAYVETFRDPRRNWVDLSIALHGVWDYKNFIFSSKLHFMKAFNYQYAIEENNDPMLYWNYRAQDKGNVQFQLGASYRF